MASTDSKTSTEQPQASQDAISMMLVLLSLWSFGVAQPLYDLISQNPTYLTAHALVGLPLVTFVFVLSLALPLSIFGVLALIAQRHRIGAILVGIVRLLLLIVLVTVALRATGFELSGRVELLLAALFGLSAFWFSSRSQKAQAFLRMAWPSALIFAALFLWQLPSSYLGDYLPWRASSPVTSSAPTGSEADVGSLLPDGIEPADEDLADIVLVVFDELALTSLLDEDYEVDARRYPNFARFAAGSTWLTQASAVAAGTRLAVPAIFTGKKPNPDSEPDAASHPANIFSLLKERYELNVEEPITRLCVYRECERPVDLTLTASDTAVLLGHTMAPKLLAHRLPAIGGHWKGFWTTKQPVAIDKRIQSINRFVDGLSATASPGLHVLHSVLPHIPYTILPGGQRLFRHEPSKEHSEGHVIGAEGDRFINEPWAITQSRFLYEWQLGYVDQVLGRIVDTLKKKGSYERSLVIITADHGVRFSNGMSRREPNAASYLDIAAIPLFVKFPEQREALRDSMMVTSTDIVEMVRQVLAGQQGPDSALAAIRRRPEATRSILATQGTVPLPPEFDFSLRRNRPVERMADESQRMLEKRIGATRREYCGSTAPVGLAEEAIYQGTSPEHFLGAQVLFRSQEPLRPEELIVVFNGGVFSVYQTGADHYSAFVAPSLFQSGFNEVELVRLEENGDCTLYKLPTL